MKNKKTIIALVLCICIIWSLYVVTIPIQNGFDTIVSDENTVVNDRQDEPADDTGYAIQDFSRIPQCFWGTWMMTEELHGQYGWDKCRDEFQGLTVKFTPGKFSFQNESREIPFYYCEIIAIEDAQGRRAYRIRKKTVFMTSFFDSPFYSGGAGLYVGADAVQHDREQVHQTGAGQGDFTRICRRGGLIVPLTSGQEFAG